MLVRRRDRLAEIQPALACGLLAALAALTRPEAAIYAATYPLALLVVGRPRWRELGAAALSVVAFAVPFGAYLAWRLATFGQWLPTTAIAKSQGLPTVAGFAKVGSLIAYAGWPIVLVGTLLVGAALAGAAGRATAAGTTGAPAATTTGAGATAATTLGAAASTTGAPAPAPPPQAHPPRPAPAASARLPPTSPPSAGLPRELPTHQALARFDTNESGVVAMLTEEELATLADANADDSAVAPLVAKANEAFEAEAPEAEEEADEPEAADEADPADAGSDAEPEETPEVASDEGSDPTSDDAAAEDTPEAEEAVEEVAEEPETPAGEHEAPADEPETDEPEAEEPAEETSAA